MKIWLQFMWIEDYCLGFFLGVRSSFKGRIRSNQAMNHNKSYLNLIAIESRMQGNRDELKICLQNGLIASRLIKSCLEKENTSVFKEDYPRRIHAVCFAMRFAPSDFSKSVESWPMTQNCEFPFPFARWIVIEESRCIHMSFHDRR